MDDLARQRIKQLRKARGWSQAELSRRTGIHSSTPLSSSPAAVTSRASSCQPPNSLTLPALSAAHGRVRATPSRASSNFALAHAGLADCYTLLGWVAFGGLAPHEAFPKARAAAQLSDPSQYIAAVLGPGGVR